MMGHKFKYFNKLFKNIHANMMQAKNQQLNKIKTQIIN